MKRERKGLNIGKVWTGETDQCKCAKSLKTHTDAVDGFQRYRRRIGMSREIQSGIESLSIQIVINDIRRNGEADFTYPKKHKTKSKKSRKFEIPMATSY